MPVVANGGQVVESPSATGGFATRRPLSALPRPTSEWPGLQRQERVADEDSCASRLTSSRIAATRASPYHIAATPAHTCWFTSTSGDADTAYRRRIKAVPIGHVVPRGSSTGTPR